jgi:hypothetical protein
MGRRYPIANEDFSYPSYYGAGTFEAQIVDPFPYSVDIFGNSFPTGTLGIRFSDRTVQRANIYWWPPPPDGPWWDEVGWYAVPNILPAGYTRATQRHPDQYTTGSVGLGGAYQRVTTDSVFWSKWKPFAQDDNAGMPTMGSGYLIDGGYQYVYSTYSPSDPCTEAGYRTVKVTLDILGSHATPKYGHTQDYSIMGKRVKFGDPCPPTWGGGDWQVDVTISEDAEVSTSQTFSDWYVDNIGIFERFIIMTRWAYPEPFPFSIITQSVQASPRCDIPFWFNSSYENIIAPGGWPT